MAKQHRRRFLSDKHGEMGERNEDADEEEEEEEAVTVDEAAATEEVYAPAGCCS